MSVQRSSSPMEPVARDAQMEAEERLQERYETRVLEPSPPTVTQGPWFADDPIALGDGSLSRPVVSPASNGNLLWDDLARDDGELARWCASRWLGAWRRLQAPPEHLARTKDALHKVAEHVMSPTRKRANGKIGLSYTWGGFGTPFFGKDVQIRVVGDALIVQMGGRVQHGRLTTLEDAAEFIGFDLTRYDLAGADEPLDVDIEASLWLGEWFGFAASVLAQLRVESPEELEVNRVQLWPEHFDMAVELGSEQHGRRATYGLSPGDEQHEEPYVYVSPWEGVPDDAKLWNARGFRGAQLGLGELLAAENQRERALDFMRTRRDALAASRGPQ